MNEIQKNINEILLYINNPYLSAISNATFVASVMQIKPTLNEYFSHKNLAEFLENEKTGGIIMDYLHKYKDEKFIKNILRYVINSDQEFKAKIMGKIVLYCQKEEIEENICERILYDISQCNINDFIFLTNIVKNILLDDKNFIKEVDSDNNSYIFKTKNDNIGFGGYNEYYYIDFSEDSLYEYFYQKNIPVVYNASGIMGIGMLFNKGLTIFFHNTIMAGIYDEFLPKTQPQSIINN